ncbi:MAG: hypothetical protein ACLUR5_05195 [Eubacterium ventriosum]
MDNHAEWSKVAESIEKGKVNKIIFVIMKLYLYIYLAWKPCIPYSKKKTAYHLEPVTTGGSTWRLHIPFPVGRQGIVHYAVLCDFLCGRSAGDVYVI